MNWNPFKRTRKKKETGVKIYAPIDPYHPQVGLSIFTEAEMLGSCFCIEGTTLEHSRREFCGKVIEWSRMDPESLSLLLLKKPLPITAEKLETLFR